jgi:hypothetical protein
MKKVKKQIKKDPITTSISNNTFTGVHWDAQAVESVSMVAKGLLNLTELFRTQNIHIDSMLKINTDLPKINKKAIKTKK